MNDGRLFETYRRGNTQAFEEIMKKYKAPIFSYILKTVKNRTAAEDIFQEVFIKVIKNADAYSEKKKFSHWLYTIARNTAMDWFRKNGKKEYSLDNHSGEQLPLSERTASSERPPDRILVENEESSIMEKAIGKLSFEQREILFMRHYWGISFKEISEILNIPLGTALARMSRGMEKLRLELGGNL